MILTGVIGAIPSPSGNSISIGPLELRAYGLMIALGALVAVLLWPALTAEAQPKRISIALSNVAEADTAHPGSTHRVAIEAGVTTGWHRFVGSQGRVIGVDCFGESAPGPAVFDHFGFTPQRVVTVVTELLRSC